MASTSFSPGAPRSIRWTSTRCCTRTTRCPDDGDALPEHPGGESVGPSLPLSAGRPLPGWRRDWSGDGFGIRARLDRYRRRELLRAPARVRPGAAGVVWARAVSPGVPTARAAPCEDVLRVA